VRGATDISGFGILGHAAEMVEASGAGIALRLQDIPILPGALGLAEKEMFSGGMKRNRAHLEHTLGARGRLSLGPSIGAAHAGLLFESETSGGLLFAVAPEHARMVHDGFKRREEPCWEIGDVTAEIGITVR
jgi:selenide,water dikinase